MSAREEGLERLLVGDLDPASEEAGRFFDQHPGAREELAEMRRVETTVRSLGRARERAGEGLDSGPLEREAERFVAERLARTRPAARRGTLLRWLPLAAAVLLVLLWRPWAPWTDGAPVASGGPSGRSPERGPLMGGELELLPPVVVDGRVEELRWSYALEGGQFFEVFVYDPGDPFEPLAESGALDQPAWRPDPAKAAAWPDPFEWRVQVQPNGPGESRKASRSP